MQFCSFRDAPRRGRIDLLDVEVLDEKIDALGRQLKVCRVGSEVVDVPWSAIDDDSETYRTGDRGTMRITLDGFNFISALFLSRL